MQNIYETLFDLSSKENQNFIKQFQHDLKILMTDELYEKYKDKFQQKNSDYPSISIKESFFDITLSENYISFTMTNDFNDNYNISTTLSYSNKEKHYGMDFNIFNKSNYYGDRLHVFYTMVNNNLIILDSINNIQLEVNSQVSTSKPSYNIYVFEKEPIMSLIINNYLDPKVLNEILTLTQNSDFSKDEIISSIVKQSKILFNHKKDNDISLILKNK